MLNFLRKKINIAKICAAAAALVLAMSGCSAGTSADLTPQGLPVYYINNNETKTEVYYITPDGTTDTEIVADVLSALSEKSSNAAYKSPLAMGFKILDYTYDNRVMTLNMSAEYKKLEFTTEVLVRAAIVRSLCGSGCVDSVFFTVEGEPLMDHSGFEVGRMDAGTFISSDGNEINTYEEANIRLYFASEDGSSLISVYREKFYSTSMPLEKFVVDELITGPSGKVDGLYPSVNPQTSVLSVSTKDGVCYVNLSNDFLIPYGNVPTSVSVYAITNSLCDLSNIDRVQILVGGVVPDVLESSYELNDGMVITLDEALSQYEGE